jgi:MYXO-CTERM domain-containing protein
VLRLGAAGALVLLALALAGTARADADPASDVLFARRVFLPYNNTKVSPPLVRELDAVTLAAEQAGRPVRVALIATPTDLGGVPALFGKPTQYARFLGAELQFVYLGRLLIVMPQGAALSQAGRLVAEKVVVEAHVGPGGDGLARAAIDIVRQLSGGKPLPPPATTTPSAAAPGPLRPVVSTSSSAMPAWVVVGISVAAVALLVAAGLVVVRRRRPL